jgi:hypothetical protein
MDVSPHATKRLRRAVQAYIHVYPAERLENTGKLFFSESQAISMDISAVPTNAHDGHQSDGFDHRIGTHRQEWE